MDSEQPAPKRLRLKELNETESIILENNKFNELIEKWNNSNYLGTDESSESLRTAYNNLKSESDNLIQILLSRLQESFNTIRRQNDQIKLLQATVRRPRKSENSTTALASVVDFSKSEYCEIEETKNHLDKYVFSTQIELTLIQQPPNQAVYQRILRPFPIVGIIGVNANSNSNFFVEVSLVKKSSEITSPTWTFKHSNSSSDKEKGLIGGQLVQRSEHGSIPSRLVVIFRKIKILTTSAQQGAFFVLKFSLKNYVDNIFEPVPNVHDIISSPIEVFSHTLYLKSRPNPVVKLTKSSTNSSTSEIQTEAEILASMSDIGNKLCSQELERTQNIL